MDEARSRDVPEQGSPEGLTRIRGAYTLAATNEPGTGDVEAMMVRHFIETLAEVAMAVASRKVAEQEQPR